MTHPSWRPTLLVACLAVLCAPGLGFAADDTLTVQALREENVALRARIEQLEKELATLRHRLGVAEAREGDLAAENRRLEELAGMTAKGEAVESSAALIKSSFDETAGVTTVYSVPERLEHLAGPMDTPHLVRFQYTHPGREMTAPPEGVTMTIIAVGRPRPKFQHLEQIDLELDGQPLTVPVKSAEVLSTERSATSRTGLTRHNEAVHIVLSESDLITLARARHATAMLGDVRLQVPGEVLATAKAMRERILLGLPTKP